MRRATTTKILGEIGRRIRDARRSTGLTQEAAAANARMDYKRYQKIEHGLVNVTMKTLARIAASLNTDVWTMLERRRR